MAFVNNTSATGTGVNSLTVATPGSLTIGNVLIWVVGRLDPGSLVTLPTGWNWLTDGLSQNGLDVNMFYRVVDGTEAASYTIQLNATCSVVFGEIAQYSDVNPTFPIYSQQGVIFNSFEGASDTFFFDQVGFDADAGTTYQFAVVANLISTSFTAPGGYNAQYADTVTNGADNISVAIFDAPGYGEGLGATLTITGGASTSPFIGFRVFLRPAAGTEPTIGWTIFEQIVVPPFTNWPFMLRDLNNLYFYAIYPTNPTGSTIIQKFDAVNSVLLLTATFGADVPVGDKIMAQDDNFLYVALQDKTIRKIQKSDLTQVTISVAAADTFDNLSLAPGSSVLWASDSGGTYFQFNTTTLTSTSFDDSGSGRNIVGLAADGLGNAWGLTYDTVPQGVFTFVTAAFAITTYNIPFADLPIDSAFAGSNYAALGLDHTTGFLWAFLYNAEDNSVPNPTGLLVWNTATQTKVNSFTYGKSGYVGASSVINSLQAWSGTSSLWLPWTFFSGNDQLVFGSPGIADAVRFDSSGVFQEKLPIDFPPIPVPDLLQELQSTVIMVSGTDQRIWMVLHADDPEGNCIKFIAVGTPVLVPPPTPPTTTCVSLFLQTTQWFGTIDGTNLATTFRVVISPTNDVNDPLAFDATITAVTATSVTVSLPSLVAGEGFWFVFTDAGTTTGNNTLCFPPSPPSTTCIDLPSPVFQQPYGTIHGANLGGTFKVLITQIPNVYDGNAYNAPILSVSDTEVTVFIPNHTIGEGYWWLFTTGGLVPEGIVQISPGNNQLCTPFGTSWWKTWKVWFESLEP